MTKEMTYRELKEEDEKKKFLDQGGNEADFEESQRARWIAGVVTAYNMGAKHGFGYGRNEIDEKWGVAVNNAITNKTARPPHPDVNIEDKIKEGLIS